MTWSFAVREFRYWLTNYRRTWRGSIYSSVLSPVLYLGAMGLGLGTLVDAHGTARLGGVSYLAFLAPGLLAAAAMQAAVEESTYPVLGSVKWRRTYYAAAASPLRPADLFHGHLLFTTMRLAMNSAIFLVVMAAFGAVASPWVLAALPGRGADRAGLRGAGRGVGDHRDQGHVVRPDLPVRADPAVPVLRDVLPGHPAARLDPAARLRHAAVARRGAVPVAHAWARPAWAARWCTWPTWPRWPPSASRRETGATGGGSMSEHGGASPVTAPSLRELPLRVLPRPLLRTRRPALGGRGSAAPDRAARPGVPAHLAGPGLRGLRAAVLPAVHRGRHRPRWSAA